MKTILNNIDELHLLGFRVDRKRGCNIAHYHVIKGRSNPRIWLIPSENKKKTLSGLKLFQPAGLSAKLIKSILHFLAWTGLWSVLKKPSIKLTSPTFFNVYFPNQELSYAIFTGTSGPHRKSVIQIQGTNSRILGYCKLSCSDRVEPLITNENQILVLLNKMELETAIIPSIIHFEKTDGITLLITDAAKNNLSACRNLNYVHQAFLIELSQKTTYYSEDNVSKFLCKINQRLDNSEPLDKKLSTLLEISLKLAKDRLNTISCKTCLCHGDFTPWNTFLCSNKLYVFDWEYAQQHCILGYDWIHYKIQTNIFLKKRTGGKIIESILNSLPELSTLIETNSKAAVISTLLIYLLDIVSKRLERSNDTGREEYLKGIEGMAHIQMLKFLKTII